MKILLDTNIFMSALIKEGLIRYLIFNSNNEFLFPEYEFQEIKEHHEEIFNKSKLSRDEFLALIRIILGFVKIVPNEKIIKYGKIAKEIMDKIDTEDTPFIASAMATNSVIWSDDKHFKKQKEIPTYNTKEIMEIRI